jgi:hydrogenase maturation protease
VPADVAAGPHVLVLGVGNPIMSDDGVGQRLLRALAAHAPALDGVEFLDAGTLGLVLLPRLERCLALLVLDAAQLGGEPGASRVYEGAQLDEFLKTARTSVHELGLRDLLDAARLTGCLPARRALVGVQPGQLGWGTGLSPAVEAAIPAATALARRLLEQWLGADAH